MDLNTDDEFFPQESPLIPESCFAPQRASTTAVLNEFANSVWNSEDAGNKESLDLPVNSKESCTLDLDLEIECHSEPMITRQIQPKTGCAPNPASLTDNSKQPVEATSVSPQTNFTTLQPLHLNSPSTSATVVSSNCAKNIEKTGGTLADKLVPLRIKGSASIIMVSSDKLASLKEYQKKGVVCSVRLAQQKLTTANSSANNITKKQIISHTSSSILPTPFPQPSLCLRAPTSAPISAANTTTTVNVVPNMSGSLPIQTTNGLPPGSQHSIVPPLNNLSDSNLVCMSPHDANSQIARVLPTVAYHKTAAGYQVLGSPASTSIPVPTSLPISNSIPTQTVDSILRSGSVVGTISPTTSRNPAASTWPTVTLGISQSSTLKPNQITVLANLKDLKNIETRPTPLRPIIPKVVGALNQKTTGKLAPTSMQTQECVVPMVQPNGSVINVRKTVLFLIAPNNEQDFIVSEVSNNPSETGVAKKFIVCPTSAVPVSTAVQSTPAVSSLLNITNDLNNGGSLSSIGSHCGDHPIDKRLQHTPVQWHHPYSGESPSSKVGWNDDGGPVSRDSQTPTYIKTVLYDDDCVAREMSPAVADDTKNNPDISAETIEPQAPPMIFKIVQNSEFSKRPNKKRKNRTRSINNPPTKMPKNKKGLKLNNACISNDSLPTTSSQTLGSVALAVDRLTYSQVQMKDQVDGTRDSGANSHVTALQWHHPCSDPLENGADSKVAEERDVLPVPENSLRLHEKVSFPVASHSSTAADLSATFPLNSSSSGQNGIVKYEVEDESEQKNTKIRIKEWSKSAQTGNSDVSPGSSNSGSGSFQCQDPLGCVPPSTDAAGDSNAQIKPAGVEIKIDVQSIPGKSEIESSVHNIPGNSEVESTNQHIHGDAVSDEPVLLSDDDYDDDYHCAQSPTSTRSTEEKPKSPDTAESVLVKNDLDFPIIDQGSIHSTAETALQWCDPFNAESAIKTESPSDSECNQGPSTSPTSIVNEENTVESGGKYTLRSELEGLDHGSEKVIHNIGNVCLSSTDSCTLENPSSSTGTTNVSRNLNGVSARPVYPSVMLKWNSDRIHKIQRSLKRRLKMKENGQINLSVKRKMGGKDTQPKKSQKLNDSCNPTTDSKQCDDRSSSSGFKMQKDSTIGEVVSNVLRDCIVRKTIQDCYSSKLIPSIQMIDDACCDSGLDFSKETLQPYLNSMGFNWVNCSSGRLLVEDPRFTTKRIEYLDQLEAYSGKNLVYLFVSDLVARNSGWQTYPYNAKDVLDSKSTTLYIVLHAMNNTSLIDDGLLVLELDQYELYKHRIGYWLKNIVLPKVPKGSMVIIGEGIFELTVEPVERPHIGHSKAKIISWLKAHKVSSVSRDLPKAMLLSKAYDAVVPRTSIFDQTIRQCGFETLYLPKHHKDLNPIEFLWQDIFDKLDKTPDVKESGSFEDFVEQEFLSCSPKATSVASHLVRKFEATYRDFDFCFDKLFDSMMSIVGPVDDGIPKEPPASKKKTPKPSKPVTDPDILVCPVCRNPAKLTGFRCFKCKCFWRHLTRKYKKGEPLPVCRMISHAKTRPPACHGCRRNQYELAFLKTYPNHALPLPPVTFKGEKRSRTIPFNPYRGT